MPTETAQYRLILQMKRYCGIGGVSVWLDDSVSTDSFPSKSAALAWWRSVKREWTYSGSIWQTRPVTKLNAQISACREQHWTITGDVTRGQEEVRTKQIWQSVVYDGKYACAVPAENVERWFHIQQDRECIHHAEA